LDGPIEIGGDPSGSSRLGWPVAGLEDLRDFDQVIDDAIEGRSAG
jgi:hypothetical protein